MLPSVQVFGVRSYHKTVTLIKEVNEALVKLAIPVQVELISDLEAMMEYGLTGIPALMVNGHILVQGDIPDDHNLCDMILGTWQSSIKVG